MPTLLGKGNVFPAHGAPLTEGPACIAIVHLEANLLSFMSVPQIRGRKRRCLHADAGGQG